MLAVVAALSAPGQALGTSTLERVLAALARSDIVNVGSVMLNLAETASDGAMSAPRRLQTGDTVVIGYTDTGVPVTATADALGVTVTETQVQLIGAGVPPGFYPAGSPLFALPAGVQYSLYEADASDRRLDLAYEMIQSRVSASVYTLVRASLPRDLADVAAVELSEARLIEMASVGTTALGAVNTGEIVTNIRASWDPDADAPDIDMALAEIARGSAGAVDMAVTATTRAVHRTETAVAGTPGGAVLMANIASNRMAIAGEVHAIATGVSMTVANVTTTVLGAVNGGIVRPGD